MSKLHYNMCSVGAVQCCCVQCLDVHFGGVVCQGSNLHCGRHSVKTFILHLAI